MLDLSKPYGVHKNIIFYGDHENNKIVYYLPNEVSLASVEETDTYDFFLQIFKEGIAVKGGLEELNASSGAIMSLGVQCIAQEKFLDEARKILIGRHQLVEDFFFSPPEWKDGTIDLIVLDATTQNGENLNEESFVDSIIGSKKPSLSGGSLKAVFNVRLDRKGAALLAGILQGDKSSVAGVLYTLEFKAIRPAVEMTITADLERCHRKVSHAIAAGAAIKYGELTVSAKADVEFIKEKLIEEGDIEVNLLSQVTDDEAKKIIDELVKDFTDNVMRELFTPYISPEIPNIDSSVPNPTPGEGILIGAAYRFNERKLFQNKRIFIDYRQRSATTKIHNPQAHLWILGNQIKDKIADYMQIVNFSDLWREHHLSTFILHDFDAEDSDLLSAEVLIWRKKDDKQSLSKEGGFNIPADAVPLFSYTATKQNIESYNIAWILDANEPSGYYYQVKFTYNTSIENVYTPLVVYSEVILSSSNDLIIIPQVLAPLKTFEFRYGNINTEVIEKVDIFIRSTNIEGKRIAQEIITLNEDNQEGVWKIRNHPFDHVFIEEERHYYFKDGRPLLIMAPTILIDEENLIADPFAFKSVQIIPIIIGANEIEHVEILLQLNYSSSDNDFNFDQLLRAKAPDYTIKELYIPVLNKGDSVHYKVKVITTSGNLETIMEGKTLGGPLLIKMNEKKEENSLVITWESSAFKLEDLVYVRVEFKEELPDGSFLALEYIQFENETSEIPISYEIGNRKLLYRIIKRYLNGKKLISRYQKLTSNKLVLR